MKEPLIFDLHLGKEKPITLQGQAHNTNSCPFCHVESLENIMDRDGNIIWLMNKFPVLRGTWPTVVIETDDDQGEYSTYSPEHAAKVFSYCLAKWEEVKANADFKSVLYLKNHGPMSGGSLRHPHSQIIGLYDYDYKDDISLDHFKGWTLFEDQDVLITLSDHPIIGFSEYNIRFTPDGNHAHVAHRLQEVIAYVLHSLKAFTHSYNYFFYDLEDGYYYIKVVPRYVTTPLYVGYKISQTISPEAAEQVGHDILEFLR